MTRNQFNRTEMFSTVTSYMNKNAAVWSDSPAVQRVMDKLNENVGALLEKLGRQHSPTAGQTEEKALARLEFELLLLEAAHQLSALADDTKDTDLGAQCDVTLSGLDKLADDDLEMTATRITALLAQHLPAMAGYPIKPADLETLNALLAKFHRVKSGPRTAVASRAKETLTIPGLIRETTSLLRHRLDRLITVYRRLQPDFYAGYQTARVVVDRGGSPASQPEPTSVAATPANQATPSAHAE